ncbi:T9SS type B sorting domain-containing protein, partial [Spirosoma daeguense]
DVFTPLRCPRFVEQVAFVVYNRWGSKVYEKTAAGLAWDGKDAGGADLPSGLYYYEATVRFSMVDRNAPPQIVKGWVQILREGVSMR